MFMGHTASASEWPTLSAIEFPHALQKIMIDFWIFYETFLFQVMNWDMKSNWLL